MAMRRRSSGHLAALVLLCAQSVQPAVVMRGGAHATRAQHTGGRCGPARAAVAMQAQSAAAAFGSASSSIGLPRWLSELNVAVSRALVVAIVATAMPMFAFAENELAAQCGGKFDSNLIDRECFASSCKAETQACLENSDCMKGLVCTARCLGDTKCISGCFARFGNADIDGIIKCSIEDNACIKVAILPPGPDAALDVPAPPLPIVKGFDPASLDGKWFKVMGWNSMYDCYDCQVNKFSALPDDASHAQALQVDVDFSMPRPATLMRSSHNHQHLRERLEFDPHGASRTAHTQGSMFGLSFWENWYLIGENGRDEPQFKFIYYNGRTVQNKYDGAFVYARTPEVPAEALGSIYSIAERAGFAPSSFCKVRNSCGVPTGIGPELIGVPGVLADTSSPGTPMYGEQRSPSLPSNPLALSSLQIWFELTDYLEDPHNAGSYILEQQERMPPLHLALSHAQAVDGSARAAAPGPGSF